MNERKVINMSKKAMVLLSGGLDSATCLGIAVTQFGADNVVAVSAQYGQKHIHEVSCADDLAHYYNVRHEFLHLSNIYQFSNCSLLSSSTESVPDGSYEEQQKSSNNDKVSTYVPFRNGVLLSAVAALAQSIYPDDEVDVYIGIHKDDAAGNAYADCSVEFADAISEAISIGTYRKVRIVSPLVNMNKAQVVKKGMELGVPYRLTTSCYKGGEKACGKCGTCIDRINAFKANRIADPIEYEIEIDWNEKGSANTSFSLCSQETACKLIEQSKAGEIDIRDYWSVGDTRSIPYPEFVPRSMYPSDDIVVEIDKITNPGVDQTVELVLKSICGYPAPNLVPSHTVEFVRSALSQYFGRSIQSISGYDETKSKGQWSTIYDKATNKYRFRSVVKSVGANTDI